jgi:hypothetical protein
MFMSRIEFFPSTQDDEVENDELPCNAMLVERMNREAES